MRKNLGLFAAILAVAGGLAFSSAAYADGFSVAIVDVPLLLMLTRKKLRKKNITKS